MRQRCCRTIAPTCRLPASSRSLQPSRWSSGLRRRGPAPSSMAESLASRFLRWKFNFFPAYRGTGAWVTYIAGDFREVRVRLPLSWRTRNYVGTIYGGSLYGAVDGVYMVMLIRILGPEYTVWDKAATIRFRKPGRSTLYARFVIDEEEIATIHRLAG